MVRRALPLRVVLSLVIACGIVGGVVAAGAVLRDEDATKASSDEPSGPTTSTIPPTTTSTIPPTTTTTIPALIQPAAAALPPVPYEGYGSGASDPIIQAYEQRLLDVKIDPGAVDGRFDKATMYALHTVQKIMGFPRSGRLGPGEAQALAAFQYPPPLHPTAEANRTEINIANQTITVYEGYQIRLITTTSTASGETFCYITPKKAPTQRICEVATTPNGRYAFYYVYRGWQDGDLGQLFNPYYFFKGRAIHGYEDVPPEPASHGCSRIPMHIANYFPDLVTNGVAVYVDGGPANGEQIISSQNI